ncbi:MAG: septation protein IspZ [Enterobacteriaceae bacterium]|nr:septation protein IspZ [Enterobacteriaceae bacterium]
MFDFIPMCVFLIVYNYLGIYTATVVLICVYFFLLIFYKLTGKLKKEKIFIFALVLVFGVTTVVFRNDIFIKLKTSVVYWLLGLYCFFSYIFNKDSFLKIFFKDFITLPDFDWKRLNKSCAFYFCSLGFINFYIAFKCSTRFWINFKVFGIVFLTIIFIIIQYYLLCKSVRDKC